MTKAMLKVGARSPRTCIQQIRQLLLATALALVPNEARGGPLVALHPLSYGNTIHMIPKASTCAFQL